MKKAAVLFTLILSLTLLAACGTVQDAVSTASQDIGRDIGEGIVDGVVDGIKDKVDGALSGSGYEISVTEDEAFAAALEKAGLSESDVTLVSIELDKNLTFAEYEIEFTSGGYEYDVDVDAESGAIRSYERSLAK